MKKIRYVLFFLIAVLCVTSCGGQGVPSVEEKAVQAAPDSAENGTFQVGITMEGGTGRAFIESPVTITAADGKMSAVLIWSSENYDYMIVDGVRYDNENPGGKSTFTIPVSTLEEPLSVIADTTAMSKPHEIAYTILWEKAEPETPPATAQAGESAENRTEAATSDAAETAETPALPVTLQQTGELDLSYATQFSVKEYGDFKLIHINGSGDYLLIPEGEAVPEGIPEEVIVLQKPLDRAYLVSTSVMDLISRCGRLDRIRLSGTKEEDWCVEEGKDAMEAGEILYAGKYRAPDYELILKEGCDIAIENSMIYHEPAVREKLMELGTPVLVEMSSYEKHPLGRLEWIRLYGILFDAEEEADEFFEEQAALARSVMDRPETGKRVAFFHVTANGLINVRKPGDYIAEMIRLAGGDYIIDDDSLEEDNALSAMNMQMEDFFVAARDVDILIYNSTIEGEIDSIEELVEKNALFGEFSAVKMGQVYCTEKDLFQKPTDTVEFMRELGAIFDGEDTNLLYIRKLE